MMFFLGLIIGLIIGIGMVALLTGNSYEDGYREGYITAMQELRKGRMS